MQMAADPSQYLKMQSKLEAYEKGATQPKANEPKQDNGIPNLRRFRQWQQMQYESGMGGIFTDGNE